MSYTSKQLIMANALKAILVNANDWHEEDQRQFEQATQEDLTAFNIAVECLESQGVIFPNALD